MSVEEIIEKFTKKLRGYSCASENDKKRRIVDAGLTGDGSKTRELWQEFCKLYEEIGFTNKVADNSYEVRIYSDDQCICHVGVCVIDSDVDRAFTLLKLPASTYAAFEVYVARGYDSENAAMDEWLEANKERYKQRRLDGNPYVVEFYDERFAGDSEDSIVEIWVPIEEIK